MTPAEGAVIAVVGYGVLVVAIWMLLYAYGRREARPPTWRH